MDRDVLPRRLAGSVAIVTGAARGIGRAVAERFADEGAAVFCVDLDEAGLVAVAEAIATRGGRAVPWVGDVAAQGAQFVSAAVNACGRVDVLHANAAIQIMGDLEETTPDDWNRMYRVNVGAVAASIRAVVPGMRANGGGSIIVTSSVLGITGDSSLPMYGATKGALRSLCRSVASAYGKDNIRCNTICPGDVDTEMVAAYFASRPDPAAARAEVERRYPLGRLASPADIANVAAFLASDESSYVSGTDIVVDGGLLARVY